MHGQNLGVGGLNLPPHISQHQCKLHMRAYLVVMDEWWRGRASYPQDPHLLPAPPQQTTQRQLLPVLCSAAQRPQRDPKLLQRGVCQVLKKKKMALQPLLAVVALLVAVANGQEPTAPTPRGPLITLPNTPLQTGAEERREQLRQDPELLALAAKVLDRVLIRLGDVEGNEQVAYVVEGVNVNIDCYNHLINIPGGTTRWYFRPRDLFGNINEEAEGKLFMCSHH